MSLGQIHQDAIPRRIYGVLPQTELLFREPVAVLQQDSNAKKRIIARRNAQNRLVPFISHGYSPQESNELVTKLSDAQEKKEE